MRDFSFVVQDDSLLLLLLCVCVCVCVCVHIPRDVCDGWTVTGHSGSKRWTMTVNVFTSVQGVRRVEGAVV